jgi:hypothetical protein
MNIVDKKDNTASGKNDKYTYFLKHIDLPENPLPLKGTPEYRELASLVTCTQTLPDKLDGLCVDSNKAKKFTYNSKTLKKMHKWVCLQCPKGGKEFSFLTSGDYNRHMRGHGKITSVWHRCIVQKHKHRDDFNQQMLHLHQLKCYIRKTPEEINLDKTIVIKPKKKVKWLRGHVSVPKKIQNFNDDFKSKSGPQYINLNELGKSP